MIAEPRPVLVRPDPLVLRPLDLGREVGGRPKLEGARKAVGDLPERERLRRQDAPDRPGREVMELRKRGGVEGPGGDARGAERREARLHHPCGLLGEGHGENLGWRERARLDLVRDPPRDRRRLARPCAGEDADRAAHRLGGAPLLGIQPFEHRHPGTLAAAPAGNRHRFPTISQRAISAACLRALRHRRARARRPSASAWS